MADKTIPAKPQRRDRPRPDLRVDLTGRTFGRLTAITATDQRKNGKVVWLCRCSCGRDKFANSAALAKGSVRSCGCLIHEHPCPTPRPKDLAGQTFGRLKALQPTETRRNGGVVWRCSCECGRELLVTGAALSSRNTKSCGCLKIEQLTKHGNATKRGQSREYKAWASMRNRTTNPNAQNAKHYIDRGITCCDRWALFEAFLADMGNCPPGLTLERINNNGHYEPDNCKWATQKDQVRNTRHNRMVTLNGETQCATEWARRLGTALRTITSRLERGWTMEDAFTRPVQRR